MAHDVFISHSSKDKVMADAICAGLEAHGIRCWIAPRDVQPGEEWTKAIVDAITECKVFLLVFSANTNNSSQIVKEVDCATRDQKTIIPFRIEDIDPTGSMKYYLGSLHWLDALTPPIDIQIDHLGDYIKHILGFPQAAPGAIGTKTTPADGDDTEVLKISPKVQKLLQQAARRKIQEQKKLRGLVIVVCVLILLIVTVICLGGALSDATTHKIPTRQVVVRTTVTEKTRTPTNEPSPTIEPTATQDIMSAVLLKNANCREYADEIAPVIEFLTVGQIVNIQGRDEITSWLNVQVNNNATTIVSCWVFANNLDIQGEEKPLPVFTQMPAHCYYLVTTDFTSYDGHKIQTTLKDSNRDEAIRKADEDCAWKISVGNVTCTYTISVKCD